MIHGNLANRLNLVFLELSTAELLDFGEAPFEGEFEDGFPLVYGGVVDRVFAIMDKVACDDVARGSDMNMLTGCRTPRGISQNRLPSHHQGPKGSRRMILLQSGQQQRVSLVFHGNMAILVRRSIGGRER